MKQNILVTVDGVIFSIVSGKLQILLIKRLLDPFKDSWALPGWFVLDHEDLETAAYRELEEETNVKEVYLEQLYTFWGPERDPRWNVVSVAYMAIVPRDKITLKAGTDSTEAKFFPIKDLPDLAFDHQFIIDYGYQRLRWKLEYTNVAQYFLPNKFKFSDFQNVYEIVLNQKLDVRNFKKKVEKLKIIKDTGEKEIDVKHRPGKLFKFVDKKIKIVDIL